MLLVSPERLNNPDFRDQVLPELAASAGPARRRRGALHLRLGPRLPARLPAAAHAARGAAARACRCWPPPPRPTPGSPRDVAEQLGASGDARAARAAGPREPAPRASLRLPAPRSGWPGSPSTLRRAARVRASSTRSPWRRPRRSPPTCGEQGYAVAAYTGQTEHGRAARRRGGPARPTGSRRWSPRRALGMGFDKPDLGFVIHLGRAAVARSPTTSRSAARAAGSSGPRSCCCPGREDQAIWAYFASLAFPPEQQVRAACSPRSRRPAVRCRRPRWRPGWICAAPGWRRCSRSSTSTARCGGCKGGWESHRPAVGVRRASATPGSPPSGQAEQQAMLDYVDTTGCRMEFLRRQLDDRGAAPCGRCDNCTGRTGSTRGVAGGRAPRAGRAATGPGVEVEPRKQWPTGLAASSASRAGSRPSEQAEPGRVLGRLTDIGWGNRLRALLARGRRTGRSRTTCSPPWSRCWRPGSGRSARSAWSRCRRRSRPQLVRSLAERLAQVGRLSYLGDLGYRSGPPGRQVQQRAAGPAIWPRLAMPAALGAAVAAARDRSCWSTTGSTPAGR